MENLIPTYEVVKKWDWLRTRPSLRTNATCRAVPVAFFHNVFSSQIECKCE